jgi:hypothetical protein
MPGVLRAKLASGKEKRPPPALPRRLWSAGMRGLLLLLVASCAADVPRHPDFTGREDETWIAYSVDVDRDDLLFAFDASARNYGCRTTKIGKDSRQNIAGIGYSFRGIDARCSGDREIAMVLTKTGAVLGCPKPTTQQACDELLRKISEGR